MIRVATDGSLFLLDTRGRWEVLGPSVPDPCPWFVEHVVLPAESHTVVSDSLAEAEAEFRRRERLLLEG